MRTKTITPERSRLLYAVAVVLVIGTGLLWRSGLFPLPNYLAKYGGDSLWALVVFLCLGFLCPRGPTLWLGFLAVCVAWSVEFLQLYHAPWIVEIRSTRLGRMVLGTTFNAPDLLAYVIGIALGAFAEHFHPKKCRKVQYPGAENARGVAQVPVPRLDPHAVDPGRAKDQGRLWQ